MKHVERGREAVAGRCEVAAGLHDAALQIDDVQGALARRAEREGAPGFDDTVPDDQRVVGRTPQFIAAAQTRHPPAARGRGPPPIDRGAGGG